MCENIDGSTSEWVERAEDEETASGAEAVDDLVSRNHDKRLQETEDDTSSASSTRRMPCTLHSV